MPPTPKKKKQPSKPKKPTLSQIIASLAIFDTTGNPGSWKCGNHNPAHIADSPAEVIELSKNEGCANWQSLS